jgi:Arc/MetJ family transcription regulator
MCKIITLFKEKGVIMPTNLALDDKLIEEARKVGGHPTKKAAVTDALKEYILRRKQKKVLDLFGTLEWEASYDYKRSRKRARTPK